MEREKRLMQRLRLLTKLDVDAAGTYDAAIERVAEQAIKDRLSAFRLDHLRHVQDYNAHITAFGAEPVETNPDIAGVLLKGFTSITGAMGTRAALLAMVANEELANGTYEVMLRMSWPTEIQELIARNREDERRHLAFVLNAVRSPARATQEAQQQL